MRWRSSRREFGAEISRLEAEIYADVGHEFNLGSPKQLEQILFYELNLPKGKRTKTGYSTDASVLEDLRPAHPMIDKLLEWRTYTKLRSTYVEALPSLLADDGRLHTTFHQAVAATGRLSSSDPNLQNIPIRTPLGRRIRRAFVAGAPDLTLVAADYSQIELRILAHVSGDEHLRDAFAQERRHPPRDRRARAPQGPRRRDARRALDGQDGQLRDRLRDERLRALQPRRTSRAPRPRTSSTPTSRRTPGSRYYMLAIKEQARTQGYVDDAPRAQAAHPGARRAQPDPAGGGGADGDQHADPGDRGRHRQDRDDPARRAAAEPAASGRGRSSRSTTSCCSRCRATRSRRSCRSCARRWRARCRSTSR